ncbi:MAG: FAD:protein FMN transferase [Ktedonobacterales bacterium]
MSTHALVKFATPPGLTRTEFRAMGTDISLLLPERGATDAAQAAREVFATWEQALSRFLPDSELSYVNRHAGESVVVSPLFFGVLSNGLIAAHVTHGRYDPTLREQIVQLGYDRTFEALPDALPAASHPVRVGGGWRDIVIERSRRRVTLSPGVGLDFGGIAKGMAVDAAMARVRQMGIRSALVNAGGDLAVLGQPPASDDGGDSWPIAIEGKDTSWTVPLHHGAMATSGIGRRHWCQGTESRHHLIDPSTGEPVRNELWSVTVAAARCELAEVAAKAAFVAGIQQGTALLAEYGVAGLFVRRDGSWVPIGSWPVQYMKGN